MLRKSYNWLLVDWSKSNEEIGNAIGCSDKSVISKARGRYAPETVKRCRLYGKYNWDCIDWTKSNAEISREHGIPRQLIYSARIILGHPKPRKCSATLSTRISPELINLVEDRAAALGCSRADVIEAALLQYLDKNREAGNAEIQS